MFLFSSLLDYRVGTQFLFAIFYGAQVIYVVIDAVLAYISISLRSHCTPHILEELGEESTKFMKP